MSYQLASPDTAVAGRGDAVGPRPRAFEHLYGESDGFREALDGARRLSERRLDTVLLLGAPGTGREHFARAIHGAGVRAGEPFLVVDCAMLNEDSLVVELFGYEQGALPDAWTEKVGLFQLAGEGTLFLRHVDRLPARLQPKVLRAVDERRAYRIGGKEEFEVRCCVGASADTRFEALAAEGRFRDDLYRRLARTSLRIPSLHERGEDLALLANHFVEDIARDEGLEVQPLSQETLEVLANRSWPGNVRQLRAVIRDGLSSVDGDELTARALDSGDSARRSGHGIDIPAGGMAMQDVEKEALRITLELVEGNRSAAARTLGISRQTLIRKIRSYGLDAT